MLQVHGGGWTIGAKENQGVPLMQHMASLGWVCVAINYRLAPAPPSRPRSSTSRGRSPGSRSTSRSTAATPTTSS
nr:alpha/beta hydrolase fold domain-containing protein [Nocardioides daphniae]